MGRESLSGAVRTRRGAADRDDLISCWAPTDLGGRGPPLGPSVHHAGCARLGRCLEPSCMRRHAPASGRGFSISDSRSCRLSKSSGAGRRSARSERLPFLGHGSAYMSQPPATIAPGRTSGPDEVEMPVLVMIVLSLLLAAVAALAGYLAGCERTRRCSSAEHAAAAARIAAADLDVVRLRTELDSSRATVLERDALLDSTFERLHRELGAMSADVLERNSRVFLDLAAERMGAQRELAGADLDSRRDAVDALVAPLRESLERIEVQTRSVEKARTEAYGALSEQVRSLNDAQMALRSETRGLVQALRSPTTRGRWGELTLRRAVEHAGMVAHCDFYEQVTADADGSRARPDLVVRVPGGGRVVVDAKTPLAAFLDSVECTDETRRTDLITSHAKQVRTHVEALAAKSYWSQFESTPDFVVMFVPGEAFLAAALDADPSLLDSAAERGVILSTPTTLIALLRTVALGWRQEQVAENAEEVRRIGVELHARLRTLVDHLDDVRKGLARTVESYNKLIGSFEGRVLVQARRFESLGASDGPAIGGLTPVEPHFRNVS